MPEQQPAVAVVVLNWNNGPDTVAAIRSLAESDYPNQSVLVVDNGSTDDSLAQIRAAASEVEILALASNLGYAEGNNVAIRHVLARRPDYVLVLNNDTLVAPDMISQLVAIAERSPRIGMVGPAMYCEQPRDLVFCLGSRVNWRQGALNHRGMFQDASVHVQLNEPEAVDFILGCAVLVKRSAIEAVGLMNPAYYLNYEDVEWGIDAGRAGFEVWYAPQAILWHKVSATLGRASPANTYYMTRNALLFFWRNGRGAALWLALWRILFRTTRSVLAWSFKPEYRTDRDRRKRTANILAVRDFFLGRFGAMGPDVAAVCYGPSTR